MTQAIEKPHYLDDEINVRELFQTLWRGKWLVFFTTLIFATTGFAYALYKPDIYRASVLLAPVKEESAGLGGVSGQLGGLASLAGISLGGGVTNQTVIAKEILQSRAFLTDFIRRHKLAETLMAVEGWNAVTKEWTYDTDVYDPVEQNWLEDVDGSLQKPTDWDLVETLKEEHFEISESKDTGLITLAVRHYSPKAAQQWAQWLVHDINEHMRKQDVAEAEARISYLKDKLNETNVTGMQQVFYQLIENETRTVMLANAREEYIFRTVDPAVVPEETHEPRRKIIVLIATSIGAFLGIILSFFSEYLRKAKDMLRDSE